MKTPAFVPHPLLKHPQAQTTFAAFIASPVKLQRTLRLWVDMGDGDSLLLNEEPAEKDSSKKPLVIFLHGLGGSGDGSLIVRQSAKLNDLGYTALRFNHRGCGTEVKGRAKKIYHSGRTDDLIGTLKFLDKRWPGRPVLAVAYSLSGNILLRMLGSTDMKQIPNLTAALAVCPPIDLEAASHALSNPRNKHIDIFFSLLVTRQAFERERLLNQKPRAKLKYGLTLREFDEIYTAPEAGFASRLEYYQKCSSAPVLPKITLPTTILAAKDDPIIPAASLVDKVPSHITFRMEDYGGHVGFYSANVTEYGDRRWLDAYVLDWVQHNTP